MSIGQDDIKKIALLARLEVSDEETTRLQQDLSNILGLVDQLQAANTEGVEPMAHPLDAKQVLRKDEVTSENQRENFQATAPATERGLYLVPRVIE